MIDLENSNMPGGEMDAEEIMRRIRENIQRRKAASSAGPAELQIPRGDSVQDINIHKDLDCIKTNWDIQNNEYHISSHRPVIGKLLVGGRKIIHGEVRRYVDPAIAKQREVNACLIRILEELIRREEQIEQETAGIQKEEEDRAEKIEELGACVEELKIDIPKYVEERFRSLLTYADEDIKNKAWLANILDESIRQKIDAPSKDMNQLDDVNYFVFEDKYRGSREMIKERQMAFLELFNGCSNVLDIGCGRGEFLELLKDGGIGAYGIDLNREMVDYCRSRGLQVEMNDAIAHLESIEDKSLDGIFLDQVVEHLEPEYLVKMLKLCHKKMKYGYYIVACTLNPLSLVSFSLYFYMDFTHKRPIPPETLRFLLSSVGFRDIDIRLCSPVPEQSKLQKIDDGGMGEEAKRIIEVYNHNIDNLNNILYSPQDYAIVGKK